jgi:hypothetical protein
MASPEAINDAGRFEVREIITAPTCIAQQENKEKVASRWHAVTRSKGEFSPGAIAFVESRRLFRAAHAVSGWGRAQRHHVAFLSAQALRTRTAYFVRGS